MAETCDILLKGGVVIDGSGAKARRADVAVTGDRIAAIGDLSAWQAKAALEVSGLVVSPGFIDMHSHSDLALLINPRAESKLRQGVTTEVTGMCGFSPAPCPPARKQQIRDAFGSWAQHQDVAWDWGTFGEYIGALKARPASVNVAPVVGHGVIRTAVMGEADRAPSESELAAMCDAARQAMEEGAVGLSTGLVYAPGMWAETEELIAVAGAIAPFGGIYFSHIRGEADGLITSTAEAVRIGREAGVAVQIAHLKSEGRKNWGKSRAALDAIDQARASGVDVSYDVYPYTAWNTGMGQLLPAWAREGGIDAMVTRTKDPSDRARLLRVLSDAEAADPGRWERRLIASVESEKNRQYQGLTLAQIAERRNASAEEVILDLLAEEGGHVSMVGFGMDDEDVKRIIAHPVAIIGSDAAAVAPYGALGLGHPHPRSYGTFPRVLGHYARDEKVTTLEDAVAKMTSRPAAKLGLADRGRLSEGMAADIVVFDRERIADRATYQEPHQYPAGIHYVMVNGAIELEGEKHHDRRPGRVLGRG
jgi:N-acyl-D-amino-acid deacylase